MLWKKKKAEAGENMSDVDTAPTLTRKQKFKKEAKSIFWIIFLVLGFRSIFFEPFRIPSGSMIPTLMIGDFILVNKFSYGLKVPFSDWFSDPVYITSAGAPDRGDVIVFKYPRDPNINFIKRVIGLPGDTVEVVNKVIYINDKPIQTTSLDGKEIMDDMDEQYKRFNFDFFKTQTGEHVHVTQVHKDNGYNADYPKRTIGEGEYFVMGDNRDFSSDSRAWGIVPFENIKGRAILVWFSLSIPLPWSSDEESFKFRPWRIGTLIDNAPGLN